jgi:Sec-independent protein secretion pathway component TatC
MTELEERMARQHEGLAMELLKELKKQIQRWMIAFFVVLGLWAATIFSFVYYLNQYDTISYDLDGDGVNNVNTGTQEDMFNGTEGQNQD